MGDLLVVNDLERLTEYGFEKTGMKNIEGRMLYQKDLGETKAYQSVGILSLLVNPYDSVHENELVVHCRCEMDAKAWDAHEPPIVWSFEEIGKLVRDGVVDWVESTPS